ncbi:MAG: NAD-dependent epimerase/dehydratase family protein [Phenylobacterium sp.]|uniref:NAD-dependent epimerase/dehydratase family protein n=1 Tax=Phenylobacterium sp. TaxID=1871053 RepID=UPI0025DDFCF7|nr:NAD-dependent epimerase/dehydratase family protein [Phenylobacterium sp.]MBI1198461.1 NAD-dependent epimerase/dehydratase family protein [Phenylobacterium sp.]
MAIIVTGAAGFIGSHLVDRLLSGGHEVVGVDNMSRGVQENLEQAFANPAFRLVEADLSDSDATLAVLGPGQRADIVWHLAANSDIAAGVADSRIDIRDTFLTTHGAIEIAKATGARRLAFASTSAVYGDVPVPLSETHGPMLPISNYGAMKLAAEGLISAAVESALAQAWIFRFPNVVGGRATHGVINDLFLKLRRDPEELEVLGDGRQKKPYVHVSELIDAMLFIVAHGGDDRRQVFNIGPHDDGFDVAGIAAGVVAASKTGARIRYTGGDRGWVGDVPRVVYSVEKITRLGWRPTMSSEQAVGRAIEEVAAQWGFV